MHRSDQHRAPAGLTARPLALLDDDHRVDRSIDSAEAASRGWLGHARSAVAAVFGPAASRPFDVRYWDGTVDRGRRGQRPFTLVIARPESLRRMLLPPSELSIAEAYLDGDVDVEGELESAVTVGDVAAARLRSPRSAALALLHVLRLPRAGRAPARNASAEPVVQRAGREHRRARDRAAVRYHYDVGNEFYRLWLDARMVYSCAYFRTPDTTLDDAQLAKLDLVCRKLRLRPGDRFLDVGCGWGALVMHAARQYGVSALGITLSNAQAALARERIAAAGLSDRCRVEILDYRDLDGERFDKVASVGMIEHVGLRNLPLYFTAVWKALAPGGLFLNHGIVSVDRSRPLTWRQRMERRLWKRDAFIERYVFPDGDLPPFQAVIGAAEGAGFETRDVESLREHYVLTLHQWVARLLASGDRARALVGERRFRTWQLYMTGSAHAFASGAINVLQTLLSKPEGGRANLPLTRDDLTRV